MGWRGKKDRRRGGSLGGSPAFLENLAVVLRDLVGGRVCVVSGYGGGRGSLIYSSTRTVICSNSIWHCA